jgi:hypothetical protein
LTAVAALAVLAAWEGHQSEASAAAHRSVALVVLGVAIATVAVGHGRQRTTSVAWLIDAAHATGNWRARPLYAAGVVVWAVLLLAVVGWDLNSFVHQAHDLPTLSYYVGRVTRHTWGRAALFGVWLAAGVGIALACLVERTRRAPAEG